MIKIIIQISIIVTYLCSITDMKTTDSRIVGGRLAKEGEFPYQISIRHDYNNHLHFCGGTIITTKHILTAAHCMYYTWGALLPSSLLSITAGQLDLNITSTTIYRKVSQIIVHPKYSLSTMENDIAIMELTEDLPIDKIHIVPIPLSNNSHVNSSCIVSGWGVQIFKSLEISNVLLATKVNILDFQICQEKYRAINIKLFKGMMCAADEENNTDACQGDSGGPLVCDGRLTGVISTGYGCGDSRYPGIYTDVQYFFPWIDNTIRSRKYYLVNDAETTSESNINNFTVSYQQTDYSNPIKSTTPATENMLQNILDFFGVTNKSATLYFTFVNYCLTVLVILNNLG